MKLALEMNDPATAFDDISNPLTAVPNVFGSLTDLLKDPPADSDMDDRTEGIASFKAGSASSKGGMDARDDSTMRGGVDVMKKESTKGAPFDPIDLTDCDYRLFVRKPAEAINVGFGKCCVGLPTSHCMLHAISSLTHCPLSQYSGRCRRCL